MKNKLFLLPIGAFALAIALSIQPPQQGQAAPAVDTAIAPAAEIIFDTPQIAKKLQEMSKTADELNAEVGRIRRRSVAINRDSHRLRRAAAAKDTMATLPPVDTMCDLANVPLQDTSDTPARRNFWQRLTGIFKSK